MDIFNVDDRINFSDDDFSTWHQARTDEKRRFYEERRKELMSYALERYFKAFPKVTNYLLEQVKHYGVKDIWGIVCENFEFCDLLMEEMRDDISDNGVLEAIEDDLKYIFKSGNKNAVDNLLLGMKQHIYWCVYNKVDCIIDECEDYLNIGYEDVLDQEISFSMRGM